MYSRPRPVVIFWVYAHVHFTGFAVVRPIVPQAHRPAALALSGARWFGVRRWFRTHASAERWQDAHPPAFGILSCLPFPSWYHVTYRRTKSAGALVHQMQIVWKRGSFVKCGA
jgi:hypothetical protein